MIHFEWTYHIHTVFLPGGICDHLPVLIFSLWELSLNLVTEILCVSLTVILVCYMWTLGQALSCTIVNITAPSASTMYSETCDLRPPMDHKKWFYMIGVLLAPFSVYQYLHHPPPPPHLIHVPQTPPWQVNADWLSKPTLVGEEYLYCSKFIHLSTNTDCLCGFQSCHFFP